MYCQCVEIAATLMFFREEGASTTSWFALQHTATRVRTMGSCFAPELAVCLLSAMPAEIGRAKSGWTRALWISVGGAQRQHSRSLSPCAPMRTVHNARVAVGPVASLPAHCSACIARLIARKNGLQEKTPSGQNFVRPQTSAEFCVQSHRPAIGTPFQQF